MISEKKWAVRWYEDVSLRSLCDFTVQMRKVGLDWPGTFQQSLSLHNEKDCSHPIPKLTPYSVCCTSGYTFQFCILKIFYCSCIIKNYLLGTTNTVRGQLGNRMWAIFFIMKREALLEGSRSIQPILPHLHRKVTKGPDGNIFISPHSSLFFTDHRKWRKQTIRLTS